MRPTYLAYVTSYLYIAVVWLNHKAAFTRIRLMDLGLHWANLGILFTTALLPFPTAVVSEALQVGDPRDERVAVGLYAIAGVLGYLVAPAIALAIFLVLPVFYGITSEGLYTRPPGRAEQAS